jgi:hypothetical protein
MMIIIKFSLLSLPFLSFLCIFFSLYLFFSSSVFWQVKLCRHFLKIKALIRNLSSLFSSMTARLVHHPHPSIISNYLDFEAQSRCADWTNVIGFEVLTAVLTKVI